MKCSRIVGTGSFVPPRVVHNEEVGKPLGLNSDQITALTGIRTRHWAEPGQASSDLAVEAGRRACEAAGIPPQSLSAILVSTTSPDSAFPSTACHVQRALGAESVMAFDLSASCSGFLYGLSMADAMIRSGHIRSCLVVAAEVKSRSLDPADRETAVLFGDGAGAVVLVQEESIRPQAAGILGVRLYAEGAGHGLITIPAGGSRKPSGTETVRGKDHLLRMRGSAVFRAAIRHLEQAMLELLKEFGLSTVDVRRVIAHQANARILEQLRRRLGLPREVLYSVIERYGNTSSASLPIALDCAVREQRIAAGDVVVLAAFGGGLTWATGLVRW
ncbi:MAG TPA: beta-ketoacyl-ACP synthase III [Nitrospira sp.]|nr:beta-ketoacyl-ACP synthase III [Nitrospira sp.]HNC81746.1 beta-ketoacyl-ACP synthase III [Nitrospira sp.]HND02227.1 beta-ketoacyl-ACP synthase III [Nitrospira sp.]HNI17151.1 beta-ketoacyl-ACP synthase III [Nitrospira sp.]HNK76291.1 beta-ketoacyl-ACP synthase III [Nitrospira sp.]